MAGIAHLSPQRTRDPQQSYPWSNGLNQLTPQAWEITCNCCKPLRFGVVYYIAIFML